MGYEGRYCMVASQVSWLYIVIPPVSDVWSGKLGDS